MTLREQGDELRRVAMNKRDEYFSYEYKSLQLKGAVPSDIMKKSYKEWKRAQEKLDDFLAFLKQLSLL